MHHYQCFDNVCTVHRVLTEFALFTVLALFAAVLSFYLHTFLFTICFLINWELFRTLVLQGYQLDVDNCVVDWNHGDNAEVGQSTVVTVTVS